MIKINNVDIYGWDAAIRGMRNPMNSWDKSDTCWVDDTNDGGECIEYNFDTLRMKVIGPNDLALMKKLIKAGADHGKFMRMITVTVDINAPLYWWKEFDTYKVGTVTDSCSTMHKIHAKEFTLDDFSHERLLDRMVDVLDQIVFYLNRNRQLYIETKDKTYWEQMIQLLPSSYNRKRTVQVNYQVLRAMYHARKNHKLNEWREFCEWVKTLPYAEELIIGEE